MKSLYRQEVDKLRAIAAISVIFYHVKITISGHELFKCVFICVDIFFVISSFLITSIVLKELVTTNYFFSFKLSNFNL
jgi:peptidoglycan/LPS O-acetylase OafA/YrhL